MGKVRQMARKIRIGLSVFEFDLMKSLLLEVMPDKDPIKRQAYINIHRQFQHKKERADQRERINNDPRHQ